MLGMNIPGGNLTALSKISTDIIWLFSVQSISLILPILTLPALTKAFSPDLYGAWVQIYVTSGFLAGIIGLYLSAALVRFLPAENDDISRRKLFSAMLWPIILFGFLLILGGMIFQYQLATLIFDSTQYRILVIPILLSSTLDALVGYSMSYFQAIRDVRKYSICMSINSIAQMIIIVTFAGIGLDIFWLICCLLLFKTFSLIIILIIIGIVIDPRFIFGKWGRFFRYSIPLMLGGLLYSVGITSSSYIIVHLVSLTDVGIYSISATLGNLLSFFIVPLSFIIFPIVVSFWDYNDLAKVRRYTGYSIEMFLFITIPASVGLCVLSQQLIRIMAGSAYEAGAILVFLISAGTIFSGLYSANVGILQMNNQTKWIPFIMLISTMVIIGGNLILIPFIGITGSAVAYMLSHLTMATIVTIWAIKTIHYKINVLFLLKVLLASAVMAFIVYFINISLVNINSVIGILLAVVCGIIIYGISVILLKTFSKSDLLLLRQALLGILPGHRKVT